MKALALVSFFLFSGGAALAERLESTEVGNGGDALVAEFRAVAQETIMMMPENSLKHRMVAALMNTEVESVDQPLRINGVRKDAVNFPLSRRLIFNREAWRKLQSRRARMVFTLHEYLGLSGEKDSFYELSNLLVSDMRKLSAGDQVSVLRRALNCEKRKSFDGICDFQAQADRSAEDFALGRLQRTIAVCRALGQNLVGCLSVTAKRDVDQGAYLAILVDTTEPTLERALNFDVVAPAIPAPPFVEWLRRCSRNFVSDAITCLSQDSGPALDY